MHAKFTVRHDSLTSLQLKKRLEKQFRNEDRNALSESTVFSDGKWHEVFLFVTRTPSYRLICLDAQDRELQIYVEPTQENVREACEAVWFGVRKALAGNSPTINGLKLVDEVSGKDFLTGSVTDLKTELRRKETLSPVVVAASVVVYTIVGLNTFAEDDPWRFLAGSVTGVVAAVVALLFAVLASSSEKIIWA